jgi:hypothetical protein
METVLHTKSNECLLIILPIKWGFLVVTFPLQNLLAPEKRFRFLRAANTPAAFAVLYTGKAQPKNKQ